jgi:hypothetical protein
MKTYEEMEVQLHQSSSRHKMEVSSQLHAPAALPPGKSPTGTHWIGGWVGPTACLDAMGNRKIVPLPGIKLPASSPSLYRLYITTLQLIHFTQLSLPELHSVLGKPQQPIRSSAAATSTTVFPQTNIYGNY